GMGEVAGRGEGVVADEGGDLGTKVDQPLGEVAADEAAGAGDEDLLPGKAGGGLPHSLVVRPQPAGRVFRPTPMTRGGSSTSRVVIASMPSSITSRMACSLKR